MSNVLTPDLCVIGAGSGGLSVAAAASQLGVEVVLIEKHKMGGDCLNTGCVPSKALLAAGKRAHLMRSQNKFGITPQEPSIDYRAVNKHVHEVIAAIEPNDSVERFEGLGVKVIQAEASFKDSYTVTAGEYEIKARRTIIATGSQPAIPPINGLENVNFFTNETIFDNDQAIPHLIVIGGGPIGMEMAQAHHRLGSKVTVIEAMKALGKDDPELTSVVLERLRDEGIEILEETSVESVSQDIQGITIKVSKGAEQGEIKGTHLLIATGRRPNLDSLKLENAGILFDRRGVKVNKGLVTTNKKVFAIGDITGGLQFTHMANYHAGIVIRRALFRMPAKVDTTKIPWVTYTDPELAHIGLTEEEATKKHGKVHVLRWPYAENDRAQAERKTDGLVKLVTTRKGKILGVSIVGENAGELIQMWSLAMSSNLNIKAMTGFVSPYPTLSEINKRVSYLYFQPKLMSPMLRKAIKFLAKFG